MAGSRHHTLRRTHEATDLTLAFDRLLHAAAADLL